MHSMQDSTWRGHAAGVVLGALALCGVAAAADTIVLPGDIDRDGDVDTDDLTLLLARWGPCSDFALWGLTSDSPTELYTLDPETGEATLFNTLDGNGNFVGLSFLDATLYGSDLFGFEGESFTFDVGRIDSETGGITFVSDQDGSLDWHGLAANERAGLLYAIDLDVSGFPLKTLAPDGTEATVGPTNVDGRGMAYDDGSGVLYATSSPSDTIHRIDTASGESDDGLPLGIDLGTRVGLAYDEGTGTLFLNDASMRTLYTVDVVEGTATEVGPNVVAAGIDGLAWTDRPTDPCRADLDGDGEVGFRDLLVLLSNWS